MSGGGKLGWLPASGWFEVAMAGSAVLGWFGLLGWIVWLGCFGLLGWFGCVLRLLFKRMTRG